MKVKEVNNKNMKAVIFARVSTKEQDIHSLEAQIFKMKEYCNRKKFEVIREIKLVESSTRGEREQFYEMIDFIRKQREPIALICDAVDRLQRSFKEVPILEELRTAGKLTIHFIRENNILDKKSNSAQLMAYQMFVLMATAYANSISDNVKRGFSEKRRNGESLGHVPLGYLNRNKEVIIDEVRSVLIKNLFEDYSAGLYSCQELAIKYGKLGLTNLKSSKILSNSQVDRMISNHFYYGFIEDKDEDENRILRPHKYQRLIDKFLFDQCQDIKQGRGHNKYKRTKDEFVLKGLIKCSHCHCSFSPYIKKGHTYIRPNNAKTNCKYCKNINESKVLSQLKSAIANISIPSDILLEIKDALKKSIEVEYKEHTTIIEQLNLELKNIKTKIYNWNLGCAEDLSITAEERIELLKPLRERQDEIEVELNQLQQADKRFEMTLDVMLDLASKSYTLFEISRNTEKREILKLLFSNLTLKEENLDFIYRKPLNFFVNLQQSQQWSGQTTAFRTLGMEIKTFYPFISQIKDILANVTKPAQLCNFDVA